MTGTQGPGAILATLARRKVDFVVIGGLAAIAHGSRRLTRDIDIVVRPDDPNLRQLEAALSDLGAFALGHGDTEQAVESADVARVAPGTTLHTASAVGRLDIVGAPPGAAGYSELRRRSISAQIAGVSIQVAGLDDLIAMKRASGRPLDLQDIADLTTQRRKPQ